jgi:hypothetical protein
MIVYVRAEYSEHHLDDHQNDPAEWSPTTRFFNSMINSNPLIPFIDLQFLRRS